MLQSSAYRTSLAASGLLSVVLLFSQSAIADHHASASKNSTEKPVQAVAQLDPLNGSKVAGTVHLKEQGDKTLISLDIEGLDAGKHGFHIHEFGDCSAPDGASAGGHFAGLGEKHGGPDDSQRHVGDLGNIEADKHGHVKATFTDDVVTLSGKQSVLGRSVIIHGDSDDLDSQPSGAAGKRVACGIIGLKGG